MDRRADPRTQFDRQAQEYSTSRVFREGETLELVAKMADGRRFRRCLDLGAGAGFTAFALAPLASHLLVTDPAPGMLVQARRNAAERRITNADYAQVAAEELPFKTGSLDLVSCRFAAHHFTHPARFLQESFRVLAKSGLLLLVDIVSPEDPVTAGWQDDVERRRDPSHARDVPVSQWLKMLSDAGFHVAEKTTTRIALEFNDWTKRSGTPAEEVARLRRDFQQAPPAVREAFQIRYEGDLIPFSWPCLAVKAAKT